MPRQRKPKPHKGLRNWFRTIDRDEAELPWQRHTDFADHALTRPIVVINGAFDILHSGHMKVITAARERAKTLIVAMDSDRRVKQNKGPHRPYLTWIERATALGFMPIDILVEIDSDEEMKELLKALKPDLRVQGTEYFEQRSKFPAIRKMFIQDRGIHTTDIAERVLSKHGTK